MKQIITPPFTRESALKKVQMAEDAWNSRDPEKVSLAYSENSEWRNKDVFLQGRAAIKNLLTKKWLKEQHYRLKKELWAYSEDRISVRFEYEWQDAETSQWHRSYGNEQWEFDQQGLMARRYASVNDLPIDPKDRRIAIVEDKLI